MPINHTARFACAHAVTAHARRVLRAWSTLLVRCRKRSGCRIQGCVALRLLRRGVRLKQVGTRKAIASDPKQGADWPCTRARRNTSTQRCEVTCPVARSESRQMRTPHGCGSSRTSLNVLDSEAHRTCISHVKSRTLLRCHHTRLHVRDSILVAHVNSARVVRCQWLLGSSWRSGP